MLKIQEIQLLQRICLNQFKGKDDLCYHKIPERKLKAIYRKLVHIEATYTTKAIDQLTNMTTEEKKKLFEKIKTDLNL